MKIKWSEAKKIYIYIFKEPDVSVDSTNFFRTELLKKVEDSTETTRFLNSFLLSLELLFLNMLIHRASDLNCSTLKMFLFSFQKCLDGGLLETAASYLIILQNLEKPEVSKQVRVLGYYRRKAEYPEKTCNGRYSQTGQHSSHMRQRGAGIEPFSQWWETRALPKLNVVLLEIQNACLVT